MTIEQAIDQDARSCPLIAIDHHASGIVECYTHCILRLQTIKTRIADTEDNALHAAPAGYKLEACH